MAIDYGTPFICLAYVYFCFDVFSLFQLYSLSLSSVQGPTISEWEPGGLQQGPQAPQQRRMGTGKIGCKWLIRGPA